MPIDWTDPEAKKALDDQVAAAIAKATDGRGLDGLIQNRDTILSEKREIEASLAKYKGIDLDEVAQLRKDAADRKTRNATKEGDWKKVEAQLLDQHTKAITEKDNRIGVLTGALEDALVSRAALEALAGETKRPQLLLPHMLKSVKMLEADGTFRAVVVDPKGEPRLAPDAKTGTDFMGLSHLVTEMKTQDIYKPGFDGVGASGSGSGDSKGGGERKEGVPATIAKGDNKAFLKYKTEIAAGTVRVGEE